MTDSVPSPHSSIVSWIVTTMTIILTPFIFLSAVGLCATLILHISSIFRVPFEHYAKVFFLAAGVFVVWLPTVLVGMYLAKDFKQKDFWKGVLRGCPSWIKKVSSAIFGYAILNFIYMIARGGPDEDAVSTAIFISGHLLPFYSIALASLYSAVKVKDVDSPRRCLNGHPVSPSAKFCEECGATVQQNAN